MNITNPVRDDKHSEHEHSDEDSYSYEDWHGMPNQMCCPYMNYSQNMCGCPYMSEMMYYKSMGKMGREDDAPDGSQDMLRQRPHFHQHFHPHFHQHPHFHHRPHFFPYFPYSPYSYDDYDEYDEY